MLKCVAKYQNLCCRAEKRKIDKTLRPFVWFLPILYLLLPRLWPGSLVNRASDSGSEGRGFESLPGHNKKAMSYDVAFFVYGMNIILVFEMYYHTIIIQDIPLYINCLTYDSCCF